MADIICRSCGGRFHETTDKYDPESRATGDMFKLKELYRRMSWTSFNEHKDTPAGELVCPECEGLYCDGAGKVKVDSGGVVGAEVNDTEATVVRMHGEGISSQDIADKLNLGHYMKVIHILKKQGLR